jgi:hypothetical protein
MCLNAQVISDDSDDDHAPPRKVKLDEGKERSTEMPSSKQEDAGPANAFEMMMAPKKKKWNATPTNAFEIMMAPKKKRLKAK